LSRGRLGRKSPSGQLWRAGELLPLGIVVHPLARQAVEIATDPELDGYPLQGIAEGSLQAVAAVRLFAWTADIDLGNPLLTEPDAQPADDRTIWEDFVVILPAVDAEDFV